MAQVVGAATVVFLSLILWAARTSESWERWYGSFGDNQIKTESWMFPRRRVDRETLMKTSRVQALILSGFLLAMVALGLVNALFGNSL